MISFENAATNALESTLETTDLQALELLHRGKVRDTYRFGEHRLMVTTDRISAFDHVLGTIPFKGQILNQLSAWWFDHCGSVAANHLVEVVAPNAMVVRDCAPLPVEMVVRGYLTGVTSTSIWTHYNRGEREFCGHTLPEGLSQYDALPAPIVTPSTKALAGAHDESMSRESVLARTNLSADDFDTAALMAKRLFAVAEARCAERGLMLVDTKYEFGKTKDGEIVVIDEMHTPDCSRFWQAVSYAERRRGGLAPDSFDKEFLRRALVEAGYRGDGAPPELHDALRVETACRYAQAFEQITGTVFVPETFELNQLRAPSAITQREQR